jgi:hypothetical protein
LTENMTPRRPSMAEPVVEIIKRWIVDANDRGRYALARHLWRAWDIADGMPWSYSERDAVLATLQALKVSEARAGELAAIINVIKGAT